MVRQLIRGNLTKFTAKFNEIYARNGRLVILKRSRFCRRSNLGILKSLYNGDRSRLLIYSATNRLRFSRQDKSAIFKEMLKIKFWGLVVSSTY